MLSSMIPDDFPPLHLLEDVAETPGKYGEILSF
jgi:hypothetical protein